MYGKIFASIFKSSLVAEGGWLPTYIFMGMITEADKDGIVDWSSAAFYDHLKLDKKEPKIDYNAFQAAIEFLQREDKESHSIAMEGSRIVSLSDIDELEGSRGWLVVNYVDYVKKASKHDTKESSSERVKRFRERKKGVTGCNGLKRNGNASSGHIDIDIDIDNIKSSQKQVLTQAVKALFNDYNKLCDNLPKALKLTDKRKRLIAKYIKVNPMGDFNHAEYLKAVNNDPFCTGDNDRGWKADIEWVFNLDNQVKFMEGKYSTEKKKTTNPERLNIEKELRIYQDKLNNVDKGNPDNMPVNSWKAKLDTLRKQLETL